jgi:prepilin-type N-terminal cleavage/methylation domain-containing protein
VITNRLRGNRSRQGFTIIEVLIALMILAIGLLGLEALSIGASRHVTRAQRLGDYNTLATTELEKALARLRRDAVVGDTTSTFTGGSWRRTTSVTNLPAGALRTVRITVLPSGDRVLATRDSFYVVGHVLN